MLRKYYFSSSVIGKKNFAHVDFQTSFPRRRHAVRTNSSEVFDARHTCNTCVSRFFSPRKWKFHFYRWGIFPSSSILKEARDSSERCSKGDRQPPFFHARRDRLQLRGTRTRTAAIEGTAMAGGSARFREKEGRRRGRGGRKRPRSG